MTDDLKRRPTSTAAKEIGRRVAVPLEKPPSRKAYIYGQNQEKEKPQASKAFTQPVQGPERPSRSASGSLPEGLTSGVFAPVFMSNSIRPVLRYPSQWDVMSHPVAMLSSSFSGFILPPANLQLSDIIYPDTPYSELEFDDNCSSYFDNPLPPLDHDDWAIQATALVSNGTGNLTDFFKFRGATLRSFSFPGPPGSFFGDAHFEIDIETPGGNGSFDLVPKGFELANYGGTYNLIFISGSSGWDLHITKE